MLPVTQLVDASSDALSRLLLDLRRLKGWLGLPLPSDLRGKLLDDQARAEHDLAELMVSWVSGGGMLELTMASDDEDTAIVRSDDEDVDGDHGQVNEPPGAPEPNPEPNPSTEVEPERELVRPSEAPASEAGVAGPDSAPALSALSALELPEQPTPPEPVRAPPASAASLKMLLNIGRSTPLQVRPPSPVPDAAARLIALTATPSLDAVRSAIDARAGWATLPRDIQVVVLELVAAWVRSYQNEGAVSDAPGLMSLLSGFSVQHQPGLAWGLARNHTPRNGSWRSDARMHFGALLNWATPAVPGPNPQRSLAALQSALATFGEQEAAGVSEEAAGAPVRQAILTCYKSGLSGAAPELVRLLSESPGLLEGRDFKKLRQAIRKAEQVALDEAPVTGLPPGWPFFVHTQGKRGLLVGGDPRLPQREKLHSTFGFAKLDWLGTEFKATGLQAARASIVAGGVDIVLALHRWCGHNVDRILQPACKSKGVLFIPVQRSYGVAGIKDAIERFAPG